MSFENLRALTPSRPGFFPSMCLEADGDVHYLFVFRDGSIDSFIDILEEGDWYTVRVDVTNLGD